MSAVDVRINGRDIERDRSIAGRTDSPQDNTDNLTRTWRDAPRIMAIACCARAELNRMTSNRRTIKDASRDAAILNCRRTGCASTSCDDAEGCRTRRIRRRRDYGGRWCTRNLGKLVDGRTRRARIRDKEGSAIHRDHTTGLGDRGSINFNNAELRSCCLLHSRCSVGTHECRR